jgi:hypothetical protein
MAPDAKHSHVRMSLAIQTGVIQVMHIEVLTVEVLSPRPAQVAALAEPAMS